MLPVFLSLGKCLEDSSSILKKIEGKSVFASMHVPLEKRVSLSFHVTLEYRVGRFGVFDMRRKWIFFTGRFNAKHFAEHFVPINSFLGHVPVLGPHAVKWATSLGRSSHTFWSKVSLEKSSPPGKGFQEKFCELPVCCPGMDTL